MKINLVIASENKTAASSRVQIFLKFVTWLIRFSSSERLPTGTNPLAFASEMEGMSCVF